MNALFTDAEWSGFSVDALDSMLFGGFGTPDEGFQVDWLRSDLSRQRLDHAETLRWLEARIQKQVPSRALEQKRDQARRGVGPTLFDEIIRSFQDAEHITLNLK